MLVPARELDRRMTVHKPRGCYLTTAYWNGTYGMFVDEQDVRKHGREPCEGYVGIVTFSRPQLFYHVPRAQVHGIKHHCSGSPRGGQEASW